MAGIHRADGPDKSALSARLSNVIGSMAIEHLGDDVARVGGHLGEVIRLERRRRRWTMRDLAGRSGLSASLICWIEGGNAASVQAYAAIAKAFGRRLEVELVERLRD